MVIRDDIVRIAGDAEKYMERNGFTPRGHPKDLPINEIETLDRLFV
jgi:hypothetical protein